MNTLTWVILVVVVLIFVGGMIMTRKDDDAKRSLGNGVNDMICKNEDVDNLKVVSYKVVIPLRIQACERLLLYLERIKFSILVKRVFVPGMSRDDFQLSLIQNVQDEFEHNLAQRLYVAEDTWQLVNLAKEEVLQNVNAAFNEDTSSDVASVALIISAFQNPMAEKAILGLKMEFDSFLV
ncbi:MAG: hypothetical protein MJZ90_00825 [Bacteroidales bacterium]|nr:hypothetical protein [Bacteroidales bacterium]